MNGKVIISEDGLRLNKKREWMLPALAPGYVFTDDEVKEIYREARTWEPSKPRPFFIQTAKYSKAKNKVTLSGNPRAKKVVNRKTPAPKSKGKGSQR